MALQARTVAWIVLAQAIGGITPALTKLALAGMAPYTLVVVRQLLGFLFLLGMIRVAGGALRPGLRSTLVALSRREHVFLLLMSWVGFGLPQILGALGLERSTATHGALLSPLEPIGILLGGALLLGEPLTRDRAGAVVLGLLGATLIVLGGESSLGGADPGGDLLMAAGHLTWAVYTLAAKPLLTRHDPGAIALLASLLSPLPLVPMMAGEPFDASAALPALGWIALLALLATAVASFAWNRALRDVSAGTMAAFIFMQPLFGLVAGALLGEPVGLQAVAGATLIVAGVIIATLRGENQARTTA